MCPKIVHCVPRILSRDDESSEDMSHTLPSPAPLSLSCPDALVSGVSGNQGSCEVSQLDRPRQRSRRCHEYHANLVREQQSADLAHANRNRNVLEVFVEGDQEPRVHGGRKVVQHPVMGLSGTIIMHLQFEFGVVGDATCTTHKLWRP